MSKSLASAKQGLPIFFARLRLKLIIEFKQKFSDMSKIWDSQSKHSCHLVLYIFLTLSAQHITTLTLCLPTCHKKTEI